jgi:hypothetical protein
MSPRIEDIAATCYALVKEAKSSVGQGREYWVNWADFDLVGIETWTEAWPITYPVRSGYTCYFSEGNCQHWNQWAHGRLQQAHPGILFCVESEW